MTSTKMMNILFSVCTMDIQFRPLKSSIKVGLFLWNRGTMAFRLLAELLIGPTGSLRSVAAFGWRING